MDYTSLGKLSSLLEKLECPKCYIFDCGVGCTYSADEESFKKLRSVLGICLDKGKLKAFEEGKTFRLYVQQGKCEIVHNAVKAVLPKEGVLHAKVYVIKYRKVSCDEEVKYRVVVTSANLTKANELNICAVFDSESKCQNDDKKEDFGKQVSEFFKGHSFEDATDIPKETSKLLEQLEHVSFGTSAKFVDVKKNNTLKELKKNNTLDELKDLAENSESMMIFSPFLSKEILKGFAEKGKSSVTLISRADQMNACKVAIEESEIQCYTLGASEVEVDGEVIEDKALHAKVFLFQKENEIITYLGSANATQSAFSKNIEALVCFCGKGALPEKQNLGSMYESYTPEEVSPDEKRRKDFEEKCRNIAAAFQYNEEEYSVQLDDKDRGKYSVQLDGKDGEEVKEEEKKVWERKNSFPHCVWLEISETPQTQQTQQSKRIPMLVRGTEELNVSDNEIKKIINDAFKDELFSGLRKQAPNGNNQLRKEKGSQNSTKPLRDPGLAERLSGLKTEEEIKKVYERCKNMLAKIPKNNENRALLYAFCRSCENLCESGVISLKNLQSEET
ncbi:MAG: phospholipase D family protein [Clostridiales bacterium]|nr:phospholipase D family protein [Clostridiales bacterium]